MATHISRDYQIQNTSGGGSTDRVYIPAYLMAIFLRRVLGYTVVGQTNYNINTIGVYLIATGDSTPSSTPTFSAGTRAGIAQNGSAVEVNIPAATKAVVTADIGRLIVLKSPLYPTRNSGIFLVTGLQQGNNTTIAAGSNGASLPQGTINVASTTGFPSSGTIFVTTAAGYQTVTYTGVTGTSFTGCTGGTGAMSTGGVIANQNKYVIDYRANGETCMPESNDTIPWYLYDKDTVIPVVGNANSKTVGSYRSDGNSTTSRIILQSPHPTGWQIRICNETANDYQVAGLVCRSTASPGFNGDSAGDFPAGGDHLHGPMWWNINQASYGTGNGFSDYGSSGTFYRYTIVGDDTGQNVFMLGRRINDLTSPNSWITIFGIPDNEPMPLPNKSIGRLFVLGNSNTSQSGGGPENDVSLYVGTSNLNGQNQFIQGSTFFNAPISCAPSLLAYIAGTVQTGAPINEVTAGDCPFTSSTELVNVDLVTGTIPYWTQDTNIPLRFQLYPRVMGTLPILKSGRTNFGDYTTTTDATTFTITGATNASPIAITTSSSHTLNTGDTVAISGVGGNTNANGTFVVTVTSGTTFTLNGSTGNAGYTSGGTGRRGASYYHLRRGVYLSWNGPTVVP